MRRGLVVLLTLVGILSAPASAFAVGPGTIFGTVSPAAIAPEVEVCVVEPRPSELCTAPDASGAYRLTGVPVGPLRVEFLPSYRSGYLVQYYDHRSSLGEATVLVMPSPPPAPELKGIDAELEPGSEIEGTITAALGGEPLEGVEVCAEEAGSNISVGCTESAESGRYAVTGLASGVYKVGFWGRGGAAEYTPQFFGGAELFGGGTPITVPLGSDVTGIDAELAKGARIEGRVTAAGVGDGLPGIPVCLFGVAAVEASQCVFTEATGTYAMGGIPAGEYQLGFSPSAAEMGDEAIFSGDDGYLAQYYSEAPNRSASQTLSLSSGQDLAGIDARLSATPTMPPILQPASVPAAPAAPVQFVGEPFRRMRPKKKTCMGSRAKKKGPKRAAKCGKNRHRSNRRHRRGHR
jgi:hypothetical protein